MCTAVTFGLGTVDRIEAEAEREREGKGVRGVRKRERRNELPSA